MNEEELTKHPTPIFDEVVYEPDSELDTNTIEFRVMKVESVFFNLDNSSPQVTLVEAEEPYREITIAIALAEAQALRHAMAGTVGRRPSTHQLTSTIISRLQADIIAARILRHEKGIFYAELDLMSPRGRERVDCRTSDALILALRLGVPAPILCAEEVFQSFYS